MAPRAGGIISEAICFLGLGGGNLDACHAASTGVILNTCHASVQLGGLKRKRKSKPCAFLGAIRSWQGVEVLKGALLSIVRNARTLILDGQAGLLIR